VRVWEVAAPDPTDRLEWLLLCDAKVTDFAQARECALQYSVVYLSPADKYHRLTRRLSKEQKVL